MKQGGGPEGACARACFMSGCPKLPAEADIDGGGGVTNV